ncbi:unnamed protein product [Ambrosiozyma monospora]|uniref:Unnamed protein product n=1 Tax=Ambrosiozyma monospora TaxID=43982 RepID=A0A9W6YXY3_AMBMO|nr:unnamed protein product [Ambrosiozyma monospora]
MYVTRQDEQTAKSLWVISRRDRCLGLGLGLGLKKLEVWSIVLPRVVDAAIVAVIAVISEADSIADGIFDLEPESSKDYHVWMNHFLV